MSSQIPKRCQQENCKHKLGLTPFTCRCGKHFCASHRYAEDHNCSHDYREDQKKELLKLMSSPVIAAKVEVL